MALPDLAGSVLTVRGPLDPDQLGVTLTHEHIFIDLRRTHLPHRKWLVDADRIVADSPDEDFPATELARWEAKLDLSRALRWHRWRYLVFDRAAEPRDLHRL